MDISRNLFHLATIMPRSPARVDRTTSLDISFVESFDDANLSSAHKSKQVAERLRCSPDRLKRTFWESETNYHEPIHSWISALKTSIDRTLLVLIRSGLNGALMVRNNIAVNGDHRHLGVEIPNLGRSERSCGKAHALKIHLTGEQDEVRHEAETVLLAARNGGQTSGEQPSLLRLILLQEGMLCNVCPAVCA